MDFHRHNGSVKHVYHMMFHYSVMIWKSLGAARPPRIIIYSNLQFSLLSESRKADYHSGLSALRAASTAALGEWS